MNPRSPTPQRRPAWLSSVTSRTLKGSQLLSLKSQCHEQVRHRIHQLTRSGLRHLTDPERRLDPSTRRGAAMCGRSVGNSRASRTSVLCRATSSQASLGQVHARLTSHGIRCQVSDCWVCWSTKWPRRRDVHFEAAVQDADETVAELAQAGLGIDYRKWPLWPNR